MIFFLSNSIINAQVSLEDRSWNLGKEGVIMGGDVSGWILPSKHVGNNCRKDYTVFFEDKTAKEVVYNSSCEPEIKNFNWIIQDSVISLIGNEKTIKWKVGSMENNVLKVGIEFNSSSKRKLYVSFKRREE